MLGVKVAIAVVSLASVASGQLNVQQQSAEVLAQTLFGSSYSILDVSSTGTDAQYGTFSGGDAAAFGIDSGIVLSSGSLTGTNDEEAGNSDSRLPKSFDVADLKVTVQALPDNPSAFSALAAIFCTCESVSAQDNFPERAQIYVNDTLAYNKQKGLDDTRPTPPFGFGTGGAWGGGPCKCSEPETYTLVRPEYPTIFETLVADIGDGAYNSWIFLGFVGYAEIVSTTSTTTSTQTQSSTTTVETTVSTSTSTVLETTTGTVVAATITAPALATMTTTSYVATTTSKSYACRQYILQFSEHSCPKKGLRTTKKGGMARVHALAVPTTTTTTTVSESTTTTTTTVETDTSSVTASETTTSTETDIELATASFTPDLTTSTVEATQTVSACHCKRERFHCPRNAHTDAQKRAAAMRFVHQENKKRTKADPPIEIKCDGDSATYYYP